MNSGSMSTHKLSVLLLGGGHAHVQVVTYLSQELKGDIRSSVEVICLTDGPKAWYSGMFPGAVSDRYQTNDLTIDVQNLCNLSNTQFIDDKAVRILASENKILLSSGNTISYDILSIDIGSRTKGTYSIPGVESFALKTRPLPLFYSQIESTESRFVSESKVPTVVIVGGGVAGIELSFCLYHRWSKLFNQPIRITLLDAAEQIIPNQSEYLRTAINRELSRVNIEVVSSARVREVREDGVMLEDDRLIEGNVIVWATGAEPHDIESDLETDSRGFFLVNSYLQSTRFKNVFGAGDCIQIDKYPEGFPPKAGVYAVREGPVVARNIRKMVSSMLYKDISPLEDYKPQTDFLSLINLGDGRAIGTKYGVVLKGSWVMRLKDYIDKKFVKLYNPIS
jgi:pyridine nucleotide-disulfide oxidoreductase family protein